MQIKWLRKALINLEHEAAFIARDNPQAAKDMVQRIHGSVILLADNASLGHPGRVPGTRELVVPGTHYIIPYRVHARLQRVEILRVFHSSRKSPDQG